jgi:UDPglucose--hexose-1-phosphate uridylyltransferase
MDAIKALVAYGIKHHLCEESDTIYVCNQLAELFDVIPSMDLYDIPKHVKPLGEIFAPLFDKALNQKLMLNDSIDEQDRFEAKVMDLLVMRPSGMQRQFNKYYLQSPKQATDYLYEWAKASNYIKTERLEKNIPLKVMTPYGEILGTINLAKPEKDSRSILLEASKPDHFPLSPLSKEYVGLNLKGLPPRANHRMIKLKLNQENFYFQFSPYVYYHQHAIVIHEDFIPMEITEKTFIRLFDFIDQFPHYFLGSNAGLPIVGGSILSHEHYQGGYTQFPIDEAKVLNQWHAQDVTIERLHWPLSLIRLRSSSRNAIEKIAHRFDQAWLAYTNPSLNLHAKTTERHNAITPIARKVKGEYILYIAFRNNQTSETHPDGIFHPHREHQPIKKENIGLIEVMGLGVLPGRLALELPQVLDYVKEDHKDSSLSNAMQEWAKGLKPRVPKNPDLAWVQEEAMKTFVRGLEDCAVFGHQKAGVKAFEEFIQTTMT